MKKILKKILRFLGYEIKFHKYVPAYSSDARVNQILRSNNIDLIFDIGANEGQFAQYVRSLGYKNKIISFEPISRCHMKLLKNSENDKKWFVGPRIGLSNKNGKRKIHISKNLQSSSFLDLLSSHKEVVGDSEYIGSETVEMKNFDGIFSKYIQQEKNIMVKIDVQGFEKNVLLGSKDLLKITKIIFIELSFVELYKNQTLYHEIEAFLREKGFYLYSVSPVLINNKTGQMLQADGVFKKI